MTAPYPHTHTGPAIVLGSAASSISDLRAASALYPEADVIACNWMFRHYPKARHVVASDTAFCHLALDIPPEMTRHLATPEGHPYEYAGFIQWRGFKGGSTGLAAVRIAHAIGYGPIILCGVPIDESPYLDGYSPTHPDLPFAPDGLIKSYRGPWIAAAAAGELTGVLSMSGWTAELLGSPSP